MKEIYRFIIIWTNMRTLLGAIWRAAVAILDWRTHLRRLKGKPIVDAVFMSNMRDETDRRRFLGSWRPKRGHFNGPRCWLGDIASRTRALDIVTEDLATSEGREKAKEFFIDATRWAERNGAKVILLAAGTKRLFGEDGTKLKELFPNLVFTIGDNGTMFLLKNETLKALENANLKPGYSRIAVLGPYGFLGEMMVKALKEEEYDIIGAGPNKFALEKIMNEYGIEVCRTFSEMGKIDAVVACTHSERIRLTTENVEMIRRPNKKLLVVDVAEPSNFKYSEFLKCKDVVIRQDAGNAYNPKLDYVLGPVSYKMFRLTHGVTFGCFAEAISLAIDQKSKNGKEVEV